MGGQRCGNIEQTAIGGQRCGNIEQTAMGGQRCGNIEQTARHFDLFSSLLSCFYIQFRLELGVVLK